MPLVSSILLPHLSILFLDFHSSTLPYTTTACNCWLQSSSLCTLTTSRCYSTTSSIIPHRLKLPHLSISAAQASERGCWFSSKWCGVAFCSSASCPPNDQWCTWVWIQHHPWWLKWISPLKQDYRSCNYRVTLNSHEFLARLNECFGELRHTGFNKEA